MAQHATRRSRFTHSKWRTASQVGKPSRPLVSYTCRDTPDGRTASCPGHTVIRHHSRPRTMRVSFVHTLPARCAPNRQQQVASRRVQVYLYGPRHSYRERKRGGGDIPPWPPRLVPRRGVTQPSSQHNSTFCLLDSSGRRADQRGGHSVCWFARAGFGCRPRHRIEIRASQVTNGRVFICHMALIRFANRKGKHRL